jgi:hypothetical protein
VLQQPAIEPVLRRNRIEALRQAAQHARTHLVRTTDDPLVRLGELLQVSEEGAGSTHTFARLTEDVLVDLGTGQLHQLREGDCVPLELKPVPCSTLNLHPGSDNVMESAIWAASVAEHCLLPFVESVDEALREAIQALGQPPSSESRVSQQPQLELLAA